jgi:ubiquinone/menaquinone biosynthesis C-methylase UbiE
LVERSPDDVSSKNYFDLAYRNYESQNPPAKLDHYLDIIDDRLSSETPALLDVGCGRGAFLERASHRHPMWRLSGIDTEADGVTATNQRVPEANVVIAAATELPFTSGTLDVVTAWDVLEHIPNLDSAVDEIERCLKPGGLFCLVVPVYDGVTGPLVRLLDRDPTHVHKRSRDFWIDLIESRFDSLMWHGIHRYLLVGSIYIHRPTRRLRKASAAILISAVRR